MRISHVEAIDLLKEHGTTATMDNDFITGQIEPVANSSFYDYLGKREFYNLKAVKTWLGY